jgi:hypothetical protein
MPAIAARFTGTMVMMRVIVTVMVVVVLVFG